jgi:hypothetical protein
MNIGRRIHLEGPDWRPVAAGVPWWKCSGGHGGDEYGNCSVYFRSFLGEIVIFWDPHYQDKAELPLNTGSCVCSCGRCGPVSLHDCGRAACRANEVQRWRRWYSEKFEGGDDLWS